MRKSTKKTVENENAVNTVNEAVITEAVPVDVPGVSLENAISEINDANNSEYNLQDIPGDVEKAAKIDLKNMTKTGKKLKPKNASIPDTAKA